MTTWPVEVVKIENYVQFQNPWPQKHIFWHIGSYHQAFFCRNIDFQWSWPHDPWPLDCPSGQNGKRCQNLEPLTQKTYILIYWKPILSVSKEKLTLGGHDHINYDHLTCESGQNGKLSPISESLTLIKQIFWHNGS